MMSTERDDETRVRNIKEAEKTFQKKQKRRGKRGTGRQVCLNLDDGK